MQSQPAMDVPHAEWNAIGTLVAWTMPRLDPRNLSVDPRKLREYLLNPEHVHGKAKARFFNRLGFRRERWWELEGALRSVAVTGAIGGPITTAYGTKFVVDGFIRGAPVRTVWIIDAPAGAARFITAYPRELRE